MIMEITTSNFNEIVNGGKPVVIDFWATWCGPCRRVAPIMEELAADYEGKVVVGKVDVEEQDELAAQFGIRNIPTVLFVKDGQVVDKVVGAMPKSAYEEKINAML
ncbi:MAG: thioredoxin [Bacteroidaceae bacterium]|nr:thioredoxin [Bacteroidaceae bacterium]MBQ9165256.1 thioredoxin [Bacteroidaceae bacterium]